LTCWFSRPLANNLQLQLPVDHLHLLQPVITLWSSSSLRQVVLCVLKTHLSNIFDSYYPINSHLHGSGQGRKYESNCLDAQGILQSRLNDVHVPDEELIKYAWPQDVWFHVDKLSSAHVYLRMVDGTSWESLPTALLTDCAQLVKANSIEGMSKFWTHPRYRLSDGDIGNKKDNLTIIYTPADNLKVIIQLHPNAKPYPNSFNRKREIWLLVKYLSTTTRKQVFSSLVTFCLILCIHRLNEVCLLINAFPFTKINSFILSLRRETRKPNCESSQQNQGRARCRS